MRKMLRLACAMAALAAAAATQPREAAAEDIGTKWLYCLVSCGPVAGECKMTNSAEYCSGFMAGCMGSCYLF